MLSRMDPSLGRAELAQAKAERSWPTSHSSRVSPGLD